MRSMNIFGKEFRFTLLSIHIAYTYSMASCFTISLMTSLHLMYATVTSLNLAENPHCHVRAILNVYRKWVKMQKSKTRYIPRFSASKPRN